ncbi:MAG TPA: DegT/DnrJ/EryC1/StrS family aminotransferase [Chthoniobacteraceae bacterium]|nr:DegT/DnrJ/EryC1/StrS family aminotransferase [Chthoniobacteraceae bacterium]
MTVMEKTNKKSFTVRPRPQTNLGANLIGKEEEELVLQVVRSKNLFRYYGIDPKNPPLMAATFEKEFAQKIGSKYALAVTSGTAALETAFGALGVGPGDEVILPAWGWISCWTAIVRVGARPVLAEINDTFNIAPGEITRLKTKNTKAVLIMHYQGVGSEMDELMPEARKAGIKVLEDTCQSCGSVYKGKYLGTIGDIGCFSFQYNKYITTGEGGMVVTDDPKLYERAVRMHDIGQVRAYHEGIVKPTEPMFAGDQFRMTELQAAVGLAQLRKFDKLKAHCRRLQEKIINGIKDLPGMKMRRIPDPTGDTAVESYIILPNIEKADALRSKLDALNVNCRKTTGSYCHYAREYCTTGLAHAPGASPFQDFKEWPAPGYRKQDFPKTESIVHRVVALPVGSTYTDEDADYIANAVRHVWDDVMG